MEKVQAIKIQIITKWSELDQKKVLKVLDHIHKNEYLKVLLLVSDMTIEKYKNLPTYIQHQVRSLIDVFNESLFDHSTINNFRKIGFVKSDLSDITCRQFIYADHHLKQIFEGSDKKRTKQINHLIGALSFVNDKSVTSLLQVKKRSNLVSKLNNAQKDYIVRRFLFIKTSVYDLLEKQDMTNDPTDEDTEEIGINFGWNGIFLDLAERGIFGNLTELMNGRFIDVLTYLIKNKMETVQREILRRQQQTNND